MSPRAGGWEPPYVDTSVTVGTEDTPPAGGVDVDSHPGDLSPEEIEVGEQLGETIEIDDDQDNGGVPLEEPAPGEAVLAPLEPAADADGDGDVDEDDTAPGGGQS